MIVRGIDRTIPRVSDSDISVPTLITAEERRKRHIAQLLHGPIQTRLLLASLRIEKCLQLLPTNPEAAIDLLRRIRQDIDDLREQDVRHVSRLLHPAALAAGMVAALRALARQFRHHFAIAVDVNSDLDELENIPRPHEAKDDWRLHCYRIVEECLNNVYFHAAARHVQITLLGRVETGHVHLSVEDDGRGFDPRQISPGIGMHTVAARVAKLDGTMTVGSEPGHGTKIDVQWYVS